MPSPGSRRPPRRVLIAMLVLLLLAGVAVAGVLSLHRSPAPAATTIHQLRQFKILFPEGFTRAQMAARRRQGDWFDLLTLLVDEAVTVAPNGVGLHQ